MSEGDWLDREIEEMLELSEHFTMSSTQRQHAREKIMDVDEETYYAAAKDAGDKNPRSTWTKTISQRLKTREGIVRNIWADVRPSAARTTSTTAPTKKKTRKRKRRSNKRKKPTKRKSKSDKRKNPTKRKRKSKRSRGKRVKR